MCKISTKVICPHCQATNVVKNGHKKDGTQNFLCKKCRKQFQFLYKYNGANPRNKHLIVSILLRNCGIRDIQTILKVSRGCILNTLILEAQKCVIVPQLKHYKSVQIDEHWSYVGQKKKKKRWLIYAYAPETDEVLAYVIGKRDIKTVKKLYQLLKELAIEQYCSDNWEAFVNVFSKENHKIGKHLTRHIEGVNNSLRVRNRRFVRKTCCFSKKDQYHEAAIKIMFQQRNYAYHTF
jgi:IS1 family transposase/transposase-like protein